MYTEIEMDTTLVAHRVTMKEHHMETFSSIAKDRKRNEVGISLSRNRLRCFYPSEFPSFLSDQLIQTLLSSNWASLRDKPLACSEVPTA